MRVTEGDTHADIIDCLQLLNADAKRTLRKDNLGRENPRWASLHEHINDLLDDLQRLPATSRAHPDTEGTP